MKTYDELKALIDQRGVHTVFGEPGEGWFIEQNPHELATFLVHMQELGVTSVLEIGTGWRAGLARFLHDDMGWQVVSVDVKDYGHHFDGITFLTLDEANALAWFGKPDLLLLDGDHSYAGVKHDHEEHGHLAAKVIAFHDIAGLRDCEGVRDYWDEIAYLPGRNDVEALLKHGYHEIVANTPERGGIGYIVLAEVEAVPEPLLSPETIAKLRASDLFNDEPEPPPPVKKPAPRKPAAKKPPVKKATVKK